MESLFASAVLAMGVVAIAGVMAASYQQEQHARDRDRALALASQTLEELSSLPLDEFNGTAGLAAYAGYRDAVTIDDASGRVTVSSAQSLRSAPTTAPTASLSAAEGLAVSSRLADANAADAESITLARSIRVKRMSTFSGATTDAGKLALVTVEVALPDQSVVSVNRLIADSN